MLTQRTLSFFGQALNNTSEHSEVSLLCAVTRFIDFSPCGRRPSVHIQLLATLIENLFLMFLLRYGQDDSSANFDCLWVNCYIVTFLNCTEGFLCALYL